MKNPYTMGQSKWLNKLREHYRSVTNGICMARLGSTDPCEGPIGYRHAIAKRHLRLIAGADNGIRANKEIGSFAIWPEQYDALQRVPISRFSAGRWSCQKHDRRFAGIDADRIDLSEPENLFKAVYRVVLRQNHLILARWNAHCIATESEEGWNRFRETAFERTVTDDEAANAQNEWRNVAHAVMWKMRDLEERLARREWNSLEYRALLLKSNTTVAGWGCLMMKFDLGGLHPADLRRHWKRHLELGYMIVIPQQDGHAIITACEPDRRFRAREIETIHKYIPICANPNQPYQADERLKRTISQKIWEIDEIGIRESVYQSWSGAEQHEVQAWMKNGRTRRRDLSSQASSHLPSLL